MQKGQYRRFVMAEQIFLCGNVVLRQLRGGGRHSDRTADFTDLGTAFPMLTKLSPGQPVSESAHARRVPH
jgi:hypothetical protein